MNVNNIPSLLVKIDNFCDYVPFVSSVTNMVDLFQKCVILPLMQKSTVQASHYYKHLDYKSVARCALLVIPVFGNIIIGVYDFSNRKYSNKESLLAVAQQNVDVIDWVENTSQSLIHTLPDELILEIFSHLDLASLAKSCCVSKEWKRLANEPILWKIAIYREIAFGNNRWAQCLGMEVVKDEDNKEELSSLPLDIAEEYRKFQSAFPEKNVRDSLMLVRLPKTLNGELTLKNLGALAKRFFPNSQTGYGYIWSSIVAELGDRSIDKSRWVLMTKDVLPRSRSKSYAEQQEIVVNLAKKSLIGYEVPETLEAATCILVQYFNSGTRLFSDYNPLTYTRCKENVQGYQVVVGAFAPAGLGVSNCPYDDDDSGVAALRKF